jgi:hypothetical protein
VRRAVRGVRGLVARTAGAVPAAVLRDAPQRNRRKLEQLLIDRREWAAASVPERARSFRSAGSVTAIIGVESKLLSEHDEDFGEAAHLVIRRAAADNCTSMISIATILLTVTSVGVSLLLAQAALVGVLRLARFDAQRRR